MKIALHRLQIVWSNQERRKKNFFNEVNWFIVPDNNKKQDKPEFVSAWAFTYCQWSYETMTVTYFCVCHKNRRKHNQYFKLQFLKMNSHFDTLE